MIDTGYYIRSKLETGEDSFKQSVKWLSFLLTKHIKRAKVMKEYM
jgi:hypothetical protein